MTDPFNSKMYPIVLMYMLPSLIKVSHGRFVREEMRKQLASGLCQLTSEGFDAFLSFGDRAFVQVPFMLHLSV